MRHTFLLLASLFFLGLSPTALAETYRFDDQQSQIEFKIGFIAGTAHGKFKTFEGRLDFQPENPEASQVQLKIQVDSVDTGSEKRDRHLQQDDFFDSARYPTITFESKGFRKRGDQYVVSGPLTIHGVTRNITLQVKLERAQDLWTVDGKALTFTSDYELNRTDFGVNGGTGTVDENVKIQLRIKALER